MIIEEQLLLSVGSELKSYTEGEVIFSEGGSPLFYYQIVKGSVRLCNRMQDGKEFIQIMIHGGQCFGETFLFSEARYTLDAIALETSLIYKLPKNQFFMILHEHPELHLRLQESLSDKLYYQYIMMANNTKRNPAERILSLLNYLKDKEGNTLPFEYKVSLTRQQLANLTGLSVETIIRTIKVLEDKELLKIRAGKIFF